MPWPGAHTARRNTCAKTRTWDYSASAAPARGSRNRSTYAGGGVWRHLPPPLPHIFASAHAFATPPQNARPPQGVARAGLINPVARDLLPRRTMPRQVSRTALRDLTRGLLARSPRCQVDVRLPLSTLISPRVDAASHFVRALSKAPVRQFIPQARIWMSQILA